MTAGPPVPRAIAGAPTPEALFHEVRRADSARPVVTFYDRSTGERAELSAASLGNWVAKTHYLLADELGLGPGDTAYVDVPMHWLTVAVWLGSLSAGLGLTGDAAAAAVAFADLDGLGGAAAADEVLAVALLPWGRGFDAAPTGTTDYVGAVRVQPDAWASLQRPGGPDDPAVDGTSRADLMRAARTLAQDRGLETSARVLITDRGGARLTLTDVLAALSVDGSVVLVRHADLASDDQTIVQEQVTATF